MLVIIGHRRATVIPLTFRSLTGLINAKRICLRLDPRLIGRGEIFTIPTTSKKGSTKRSRSKKPGQGRKKPSKPRPKTAPLAIARNVHSALGGSRRVKHRELVGALTTANNGGFQLLGLSGMDPGYDINPANALVFPWLYNQALSYEKYKFHSLKFSLQSANPATVSGLVYMAFDYDIDDDAPITIDKMGQMQGLVSGSIWRDHSLVVNCARMNSPFGQKFVSVSAPMNGSEPRTVYGGFLVVAATGCSAVNSLNLWVDYDVELLIPQAAALVREAPQVGDQIGDAVIANYPFDIGIGTIPRAVPGLMCPALATPAPAGDTVKAAFDLGGFSGGVLSIASHIQTLGQAPVGALPSKLLRLAGYDSDGDLLQSNIASVGWSPQAQGDWTAGNAMSYLTHNVQLAALKALYPTIRYLVPYLTQNAETHHIINRYLSAKLEL